ncbi:MAG: hypothetical protein SGBAC_004252 [Bacillariaceae sp.]
MSEGEANSSAGKCPVDPKDRNASSLWKLLGVSSQSNADESIPASLEEAAKHAQEPHPGQRLPLSTHRASSTIPRGKVEKSPHHQRGEDGAETWVYPSEQQVFNAMKRKGWDQVEEESIPSFIQIHNAVNERSWRALRDWESNPDIKLVRFQGRPDALSPKAWIWTNVLFQNKPFDRHDWYVDNGVDHEKRYILDYYMTENAITGLPKVDIDVRPALDTPWAFFERAQKAAGEIFPGIAKEVQRMQQTRPASS